ncbi:cytochrome P450 714C2-like isoform X1 [Prosopis cineraria]|uniref:cytochrome P450 714C2-like isoform X1 n=1 Tax=Prosopis cineraria TaxID=364024 RepID=UPI00240EA22D|nr:cytochrome P450 714C2-like isoform X1 [Prosopis cineraria]
MMILVTVILGGLFVLAFHALVALFLKPRLTRESLRTQGIYGPFPHFFFGNVPEMKSLLQEVHDQSRSQPEASPICHRWPFTLFPHLPKWRNQYGPICLYYRGSKPFLMVQDTEMVKEVSLYTSLDLGKPSYLSKDHGPLFGLGILSSSGPLWAHQRKIIAPQLYLDKVKGMVDLMVESTNTMVRKWEARIDHNEKAVAEIKIDEDLRSLSADIIAKACFGSSYEKGQEIFTKLRFIQKLMSKSTVGIPGLRYLPTRSNREIWALDKEISSMIKRLVNQRLMVGNKQDLMQMIMEGATKCNEDGGGDDLLSNPISRDKFIVDNCKNIYFAGQETTAITVSWALMLLAEHQDWQDRCRAEVLQVCGNGTFDATMLRSLKTVTMVIQETLRLYPPATFVIRSALQDIKLKRISIPKGMNIQIPIPLLQQDPELWGPDANMFNPQRFANGIMEACKTPQAYLPFGIGARICAGQHFAMAELKVILSLILLRFQFSLSSSYRHSPAFRLVIEPGEGVVLMVRRI